MIYSKSFKLEWVVKLHTNAVFRLNMAIEDLSEFIVMIHDNNIDYTKEEFDDKIKRTFEALDPVSGFIDALVAFCSTAMDKNILSEEKFRDMEEEVTNFKERVFDFKNQAQNYSYETSQNIIDELRHVIFQHQESYEKCCTGLEKLSFHRGMIPSLKADTIEEQDRLKQLEKYPKR